MTHRRGEDSPLPEESAVLAAPAVEGASQKVRMNQSDSMANVSPTEYLLPFGSERPAMDDDVESIHDSGVEPARSSVAVEGAAEQRDEDGAIYV